MDLTPTFKSPYSDFTYNSPWFHNNPALPGPEGNNVRTYTNATDYTRLYSGRRAQIAVMGPNIDENIRYFDFNSTMPRVGRETGEAWCEQTPAARGFQIDWLRSGRRRHG